MKTMICCQSASTGWKAVDNDTRSIAMAATLGAAAKKAVTGVGAPS